MSNLTLSKQGIELIKEFEGCRLNVYLDSAGLRTIGIGHLIKSNESFTSLTEEEAVELFLDDIKNRLVIVNQSIKVNPTQAQFDACFSLAFNIGLTAFANSSVCKNLNAGKIQAAGDSFLLWNKAGGRVIKGLVNRRTKERQVFLTGNYN